MSKLKDDKITIYEALQKITDGNYVMPAFQRQFVWSMDQIEKLWDSILLNYPIASFLFWHVDDSNISGDTYFCNFLENVTFDNRKQADSVNFELISINDKSTNTAVLDGQQRLTSLYLSLFGEAYKRPKNSRKNTGGKLVSKLLIELDKNKVSINEEEYNDKKFDIKFSEKFGKYSSTQFELKNIIDPKYRDDSKRAKSIEEAITNVPTNSKEYARGILQNLYNRIFVDKLIKYTNIIGMNQDDALEMFVRFNSGGKVLRKSEITMSILEAYWPSAKTEFGNILKGSYKGFDSDFIIRSAMMLYGDVVKSNINKQIAENMKNDWNEFKNALVNLEKLLNELNIDVSHFSSSWNVLLPIIYYIYFNPEYYKNSKTIRAYLLRAIFFTYFQSGTTSKLQQMKSNINSFNFEFTLDMLNQMNDLRVTDNKIDDVLNSEKGSRVAGEVLYYLSINWINRKFRYEQDHLHPDNRFNAGRPSSVTQEEWKRWCGIRNRLPNLHFLEGRSNGSKNDMSLIDYCNDMNGIQKSEFFQKSMIPLNISLEIQDFGTFYEARKNILKEIIRDLLG